MSQAGDERELDLSPWREEDAEDEEDEIEVEMGGAKEESPIEVCPDGTWIGSRFTEEEVERVGRKIAYFVRKTCFVWRTTRG